ncbi:hypothetical protein ACOAM9_27425 [Pseudomonas aeruginosa]
MSMSQLESRLSSGAEGIWGRFCKTISEVDLRMAAIVPAAIGVITFVAGVGQEAHGQTDLLIQGGRAALDAYKAVGQSNPLSIPQLVIEAFTPGGMDLGFGGRTQGIGVGLMSVGPLMGAASVLLARGFERIKEGLGAKADQAEKAREAEQSRQASMYLGGSLALSGLGSKPGFYVDGRQAGLDGEEPAATIRPR